jgi:hypothetical protein
MDQPVLGTNAKKKVRDPKLGAAFLSFVIATVAGTFLLTGRACRLSY